MNVIHLFTFRNLIFAKPLEMCKTLFENWTLQCWMHFLITSLDGSILWRVCENFLFTFERMREFFCCVSNLVICLVSHDWFIFIVSENVLKCLILHFLSARELCSRASSSLYFRAMLYLFTYFSWCFNDNCYVTRNHNIFHYIWNVNKQLTFIEDINKQLQLL